MCEVGKGHGPGQQLCRCCSGCGSLAGFLLGVGAAGALLRRCSLCLM